MEERRTNLTSLIGMVVMFVILMYFMYNNQSTSTPTTSTETKTFVENKDSSAEQPLTSLPTDSLGLNKYKEQLGAFGYAATLPSAKEGAYTEMENELIKVQVSNKGGYISYLLIKNQKTYNGKPVELIKDNNASFSLKIATNDHRTLETKDLYFEPTLSGNTLSMKLKVSATEYLEYLYTLRPDEYFLDFQIRSVGLSKTLNTGDAPC